MIVFLEIQPKDPAGLPPIRVCSAANRRAQGWDAKRWAAALFNPGELGLTLFNGEIGSDLSVGSAAIVLSELALLELFPHAIGVRWSDASYRMWCGDFTGPANGAYPHPNDIHEISTGRVVRFEKEGNSLKLSLDPSDGVGEKKVLFREYAGTGGAEGPFDLRGTLKPWLFGHAKNVEPVLIDPDNNVYQFSGYGPIQSVTTLFERGSAFGDPVGDYADYIALVAANIPAGCWATSLSAGLIRLGAPQFGVITGDVQGHFAGGIQRRLPGHIIQHIAGEIGVPAHAIDSAAMTALSNYAAALPHGGTMNLYLNEQVQFIDLARRICNGYNAQAGFDFKGRLIAPRIFVGSPLLPIDARGRQRPLVSDFVEADTPAPFKKIVMSADHSWRVHDLSSEVAFSAELRPAGFWRVDETYREGDVAEAADKSTWLYIGAEPSSGNPLPSYPILENMWWSNLTPPVDSREIRYEDGSSLEDLKPAEPGATAGATQQQIDDITVAVMAAQSRGQLFFRTVAPSASESHPGDTWIDGHGYFYDRAESEAAVLLGGSAILLGGYSVGLLTGPIWVLAETQPLFGNIASTAVAAALAQSAYDSANDAIDGLIGLADDGNLSRHEKITALLPRSDNLESKWVALFIAATALSVSSAGAAAARENWLDYLGSLFPDWRDIDQDTPVDRATYDALRNAYDEELYLLDLAIQNKQNANATAALQAANAAALLANDAQATADGKVQSFFQDEAPIAEGIGDLWFDTDNGNVQYRWNGTDWVVAQDQWIGVAIQAAADAQATADGKVTTFTEETAPTAEGVGDLWYQPSTGFLKRWNGAAWVNIATLNNARGDYSATVAYQPGDIVLWTDATGGDGSGYIRIGTGSTTGQSPNNATYWKRFVQSGASTNVIWTKSATLPATPAASAAVPTGWYQNSQSLPAGNLPIWVSYGVKTGTTYAWQAPVVTAAADLRLWEAIDQNGKIRPDKVDGDAIIDEGVDTPNIDFTAVSRTVYFDRTTDFPVSSLYVIGTIATVTLPGVLAGSRIVVNTTLPISLGRDVGLLVTIIRSINGVESQVYSVTIREPVGTSLSSDTVIPLFYSYPAAPAGDHIYKLNVQRLNYADSNTQTIKPFSLLVKEEKR